MADASNAGHVHVLLRAAASSDVPALVDVQVSGALHVLTHMFPQDVYPFPRVETQSRWEAEIADPGVAVEIGIRVEHADVPHPTQQLQTTAYDLLLHLGDDRAGGGRLPEREPPTDLRPQDVDGDLMQRHQLVARTAAASAA
jgi:hypothetical protein